MTKLTEHFTLEEFLCHCPNCKGKLPSPKIIINLKKLALAMEKLRIKAGKPIHIHCGYRCPSKNKSLPGAAKNSFHMAGYAADWHIEGMTEEKMFQLAAGISINRISNAPKNNYGFTGVGYYKGQHFCHTDIAPSKPRPNTWKK